MNLPHQPPADWASRPGCHKGSGARFQVSGSAHQDATFWPETWFNPAWQFSDLTQSRQGARNVLLYG